MFAIFTFKDTTQENICATKFYEKIYVIISIKIFRNKYMKALNQGITESGVVTLILLTVTF